MRRLLAFVAIAVLATACNKNKCPEPDSAKERERAACEKQCPHFPNGSDLGADYWKAYNCRAECGKKYGDGTPYSVLAICDMCGSMARVGMADDKDKCVKRELKKLRGR